ncbi:TPA: histidinol dehydrogenase [Legionella pneumophila]|uniref:histidinol dehydrogenase n=1 Tax=Legionella pneumophila TaxID=446 RepID=UPI00078820CB|nr:histidinol dehydrogenase [Legionella pneumophila]MDW8879910.1 histidinol dehydrogenase [Legionella pneumophila subsp. fraseri]MDW8962134.1 histidinol dehydrogenase [Legionella pneumophila subsp. fraseri]MDW9034872.1 histidinol dehydrogenase [Legionella pneumophila subsp. fraseri]MDW9037452.1 histidinol dehydrogenase [Legionella pneumophila subsp. fraseri]MDW9040993.1 histidinol dehydrogenase [Legionella pneumophila subsp. fraseri]
MLTIKNWQLLSENDKKLCLSRPRQSSAIKENVLDIINQVQLSGDKALYDLTKQFDRVNLQYLQVPQEKIEQANIPQNALTAITQAIGTISSYHQSLLPENTEISTASGITIRNVYRPIQKVGLYVPGGNKTPLVSSLLMQAIPAKVAGCPIKVLCTPPDAEGKINEHILVAARLCGIDTIYAIGGVQAIAAMAYGTESIIKVDKIFGPGNIYVTQAKTLVAIDPDGAAVDMPAGPSEVMILADNQANPEFIAADLLAQAEHGPDSQVILICDDCELANQVNQHLEIQMSYLSRTEFIKQSLVNSMIIICTNPSEQLDIINSYAPEHLIINRKTPETWVEKIMAAGTVFLGSWAAETMGDYVTGSNHVLPTSGFARNHSGLSTLDFMTRFTVQAINQEGIRNLGPAAMTLAEIEGLDAHANAVQIRLNTLEV